MKMNFLGLMVKRLNRVENTIDRFDVLTLNVANFLSEEYQENEDPNEPDVVEFIGSLLMSMMLPGLVVATFFLVIKVIISLASRIKVKRLSAILEPNKYKKLNKISLRDPEMLTVPRQPKKQNHMLTVRVTLTVVMIFAVFTIVLGHGYIWNKWGANIDSVQNFLGDKPMSVRDLHQEMAETLKTISKHLNAVQAYMPTALAELGVLSFEMQDIIEEKIERVTTKGADFADLASNLNSFVMDSDNKTLSLLLSLVYVGSSVFSMWFWYLLISHKFEHHLGWYAAVIWWCSTFLTFVLMNLYSTMFIPYLTSVIQPDSQFILDMMGGRI